MRWGAAAICCLAAALGIGALTACGSGTGAGESDSFERADAGRLILGPRDLGRGYAIVDDSDCRQFSPEEYPEGFTSFILETRAAGCANEIYYIWGGARTTVVPRSVRSGVAIFDNETDARRAMELGNQLISFMVAESARHFDPIPDFGHDALAFRGYHVSRGAGVIWRNGNALAIVFAGGEGMSPEEAPKLALELARKQQDRMEHPREKTSDEPMDPELPLNDPTLDVPVWWLGRGFAPGGGLPALRFGRAYRGPAAPVLRFTLELEYGDAGDETYGVKLWVFHPDAFEKFKGEVIGRIVANARCSSATTLKIPEGHAVIWAGFAKPVRGPCPNRPPDRYVAYVYLKGAVVTVNHPSCLYPCSSPLTGTPDPYNSARGLAAVAKALRIREPRPS